MRHARITWFAEPAESFAVPSESVVAADHGEQQVGQILEDMLATPPQVTAPRSVTPATVPEHARVLRPALATVFDANPPRDTRLKRTVEAFDREIDRLWEGHDLAA